MVILEELNKNVILSKGNPLSWHWETLCILITHLIIVVNKFVNKKHYYLNCNKHTDRNITYPINDKQKI